MLAGWDDSPTSASFWVSPKEAEPESEGKDILNVVSKVW
jgi:hypothetical protein